jgi:hypothetical protein
VRLSRESTDPESLGDLLVGETLGHELRHLSLPGRQVGRIDVGRRGVGRGEGGQYLDPLESLRHRPTGIERAAGSLVAATRRASEAPVEP